MNGGAAVRDGRPRAGTTCGAFLCAVALLAAGGCDWRPRDPDGTLERVRTTGVVRVGLIGAPVPAASAFVPALAAAAGASPRIERGALEPMLQRLDRGEIDVVVAEFANDSPWLPLVGAAPPIDGGSERGKRIAPRAVVRAGENGWLMLVEDSARVVAQRGGAR